MHNLETYEGSQASTDLAKIKEELDLMLQCLECRLERLYMRWMKKWATEDLEISVDSTSHLHISPYKVKKPSYTYAYSLSPANSFLHNLHDPHPESTTTATSLKLNTSALKSPNRSYVKTDAERVLQTANRSN